VPSPTLSALSIFASFGLLRSVRTSTLFPPRLQLSWGKLRAKPATRQFDESVAPSPSYGERFARQQSCRHPPRFPTDWSFERVDHHLSGPTATTFTRTPLFERHGIGADGRTARPLSDMLLSFCAFTPHDCRSLHGQCDASRGKLMEQHNAVLRAFWFGRTLRPNSCSHSQWTP